MFGVTITRPGDLATATRCALSADELDRRAELADIFERWPAPIPLPVARPADMPAAAAAAS